MIAVLVALVSRVVEYLRVLEVGVVGFEDSGWQQHVINAAQVPVKGTNISVADEVAEQLVLLIRNSP
eukprot:790347-Pelagomonas_calceolata.AAC.1